VVGSGDLEACNGEPELVAPAENATAAAAAPASAVPPRTRASRLTRGRGTACG